MRASGGVGIMELRLGWKQVSFLSSGGSLMGQIIPGHEGLSGLKTVTGMGPKVSTQFWDGSWVLP